MKLLDERFQVREAITNFQRMWGSGTYYADKRGRAVGEELSRLDPETATVAVVNEIIGNRSWVRPRACGECGSESWQIVEIGEPADHESRTAELCRACLLAGAQLAARPT